MNNRSWSSGSSASVSTIAAVGLSAAMSTGQATYPNPARPAYTLNHANSSYSEIYDRAISTASYSQEENFAQAIAKFYIKLSEGQEPLGTEFEAIWDANLDHLYES